MAKVIWFVRDIASQGSDFFMWDSGPDAEARARLTFMDSEYQVLVGYSPLGDDPNMTAEKLRTLFEGYKSEAAKHGETYRPSFEIGSASVPDSYHGEFIPNRT